MQLQRSQIMFKQQVTEINNKLLRTNKAIISLGCSFVQGQGAVNDELYTEYTWKYKGLGSPLEIDVTADQRTSILQRYLNVKLHVYDQNKLDFTFMEYDNSFVSVLCNKYFNGEYVPINLGQRGCGNRATIKELYFYPEIHWDKIDEIIVIYCPSGLERFDFIHDSFTNHYHWKCMWPHYENVHGAHQKKLWEGYNKTVWSETGEVLEQIAHVQELLTWCKSKNAKLIITPGFDTRYDKGIFEEAMRMQIVRNENGEIVEKRRSITMGQERSQIVNLFPWDKMFKPQGYSTFIELAVSNEKGSKPTSCFFSQYIGKGSPTGWVTPCAHPSAKAHNQFAYCLHKHIQSTLRIV